MKLKDYDYFYDKYGVSIDYAICCIQWFTPSERWDGWTVVVQVRGIFK